VTVLHSRDIGRPQPTGLLQVYLGKALLLLVAQGDQVVEVVSERRLLLLGGVEPELHAIEELKARQVYDRHALWLLFCAEEDGCREDPLKTFNHAAIVRASRSWAALEK